MADLNQGGMRDTLWDPQQFFADIDQSIVYRVGGDGTVIYVEIEGYAIGMWQCLFLFLDISINLYNALV